MSAYLLGLVSAIYLVAGISLFVDGKVGLGLFCAGCVVANCGLMIQARG